MTWKYCRHHADWFPLRVGGVKVAGFEKGVSCQVPGCVAHHQFGHDVIGELEEDVRALVVAHQLEFDIGLQGPDIFFLYRSYRKNWVSDYGYARHREPAISMFGPMLNRDLEGAALAYVAGLVCHFTLDAACHPYIDEMSEVELDHHRIEAAYDRHIMATRWAKGQKRHSIAHTQGLDICAMASLWPDISEDILRECLLWRRVLIGLVDVRPFVRMARSIPKVGELIFSLSLPDVVPRGYESVMERLMAIYSEALTKAAIRIGLALGAMGTAPATLEGFHVDYGGRSQD